jgi:hypothetical protein
MLCCFSSKSLSSSSSPKFNPSHCTASTNCSNNDTSPNSHLSVGGIIPEPYKQPSKLLTQFQVSLTRLEEPSSIALSTNQNPSINFLPIEDNPQNSQEGNKSVNTNNTTSENPPPTSCDRNSISLTQIDLIYSEGEQTAANIAESNLYLLH